MWLTFGFILILCVRSTLERRRSVVFTVVRRISDRVISEAAAWFGAHEDLGFKVISYVRPTTISVYMGESTGVTDIRPKGIVDQILEASQRGRSLSTIFVKDPKMPIDVAYVITIDMDLRRVDRKLSSPELLLDPWLKPRTEPWFGELIYSADVQHSQMIDLLDTPFVGLGGRPFRAHYEHRFFKRQNQITESFGYSRRFDSLFLCLAPQLDLGTCLLLRCALGNLWTHEQWMRRKVDLMDAERALSEAHLDVTLVHIEDHGYFHDEVLTQVCVWTDADQNVIAQAEVTYDEFPKKQTFVSLCVFGSIFSREEANRLLKCFKDKTEIDMRNDPKYVPKWK